MKLVLCHGLPFTQKEVLFHYERGFHLSDSFPELLRIASGCIFELALTLQGVAFIFSSSVTNLIIPLHLF